MTVPSLALAADGALSPWLPVPASSLQAALANACTSVVSRQECQPGMWWQSTIAWQTTRRERGVRPDKKDRKREGFKNNEGSKRGKRFGVKTGLGRLLLSLL